VAKHNLITFLMRITFRKFLTTQQFNNTLDYHGNELVENWEHVELLSLLFLFEILHHPVFLIVDNGGFVGPLFTLSFPRHLLQYILSHLSKRLSLHGRVRKSIPQATCRDFNSKVTGL
jgi:hypothetical protein